MERLTFYKRERELSLSKGSVSLTIPFNSASFGVKDAVAVDKLIDEIDVELHSYKNVPKEVEKVEEAPKKATKKVTKKAVKKAAPKATPVETIVEDKMTVSTEEVNKFLEGYCSEIAEHLQATLGQEKYSELTDDEFDEHFSRCMQSLHSVNIDELHKLGIEEFRTVTSMIKKD